MPDLRNLSPFRHEVDPHYKIGKRELLAAPPYLISDRYPGIRNVYVKRSSQFTLNLHWYAIVKKNLSQTFGKN